MNSIEIRLHPPIGAWVLPFTFALVVWACTPSDKSAPDGRLRVVATTGMIGDAVGVIAGDKVDLSVLMGPGVDPHLYKATSGDISRLQQADAIFYNGLHLEAKLTEILEDLGKQKPVAPVARAIPADQLRYVDSVGKTPDPHIWFDLELWGRAVGEVERTLSTLDTVNAALYRTRAAAYRDSIAALHAWVAGEIATVPEAQRVLVTAHDAFGYFGRAYGIEVRGLQGISTVSEAGLYDVTHMIDLLVERRIKAVFVESSVPRKSIEAVVAGCAGRDHSVVIGGQLYSDAMGTAGTPDGTYLGMVRANVNAIVTALR